MTLLQEINNYWQIIVAVVAMVWCLVSMYWKVNDHTKQLIDIDMRTTKLEGNADSFREEIKVSIGRIETTMEFIKQSIVELKAK